MAVLYRPTHQWQGKPSDPDGWVSCGAYSTAMGVDAVSGGAIVPSGDDIRQLTNEPKPQPGDPGLTLAQLIAACDRFGLAWVDRTGKRWNVLINDLKQRRWLVVNVWYPLLGAFVSQKPPNAFGHAMGVMAISSDGVSALVYDPLAHAERWMPLSTLRRAAEDWGVRTGHPGAVVYMASVPTIPLVKENR